MAREGSLGVDANAIVSKRDEWESTRFDLFVTGQCLLVKALIMSDQEHWENLRCASFLSVGTVVKFPRTEGAYAVHGTTPHLVHCVDLREEGGENTFRLNWTVSDHTLSGLDGVLCSRRHTLVLDVDGGLGLIVEVEEWEPMLTSVVRISFHRMTKTVALDLCDLFGTPARLDEGLGSCAPHAPTRVR